MIVNAVRVLGVALFCSNRVETFSIFKLEREGREERVLVNVDDSQARMLCRTDKREKFYIRNETTAT